MTQRTGTAALARRAVTGATAMLAATALLAGCTGKDGGSAAPSPSPDPKADLLAAVPDEKDPAFLFSGTDADGTVTGSVDPASKGIELNVTEKDAEAGFTMKMSFRFVDQQSWVKVDFGGSEELHTLLKLPKNWMELDKAKLTDSEAVPGYEGADPGNARPILATATTVEKQADGTYTGTVDLSGQEAADAMDSVDVAALGDAAKAVPFTAVVGPDGNLNSLTLDIPAAGKQKALKFVVKYYDFGKAPAITAPEGATAAPASAYEMFNS
ncbi:hypothetical protein AB0873_03220 [Micromonospora sp. NPDC047707]|uniref:hypothetical protein n=1 Tax=Micromonospora sp. NPDC047707 TaxID=3154498 RepID=UPI003455B483